MELPLGYSPQCQNACSISLKRCATEVGGEDQLLAARKQPRLDNGTPCISTVGPFSGSPINLPTERSSLKQLSETFRTHPQTYNISPTNQGNELSIIGATIGQPQEQEKCDTCFGKINVMVGSSRRDLDIYDGVHASVTPLGSRSLRVDSQGQYIGLVEPDRSTKILHMMTMVPSLKLDGFLTNPAKDKKQLRLSIDFYGPGTRAKEIGKYLSKEKLFLQDSPHNELGLPYNNPHILKISEEAMRQLDGQMSRTPQSKIKISIEEAKKCEDEVSKLFDSEVLPSLSYDIESILSRSILTPLLEHQKDALRFMLSKEQPLISPTNLGLWGLSSNENGAQVYFNKINNVRTTQPPPTFRGGILADEMGLGKTLSILSLIAASLDHDTESNRRPTLIVTPKSTVPGWEDQVDLHTTGLSRFSYTRRLDCIDFNAYDIVLTTYGIVANEGNDGLLSRHPWRRVVLDEAHIIRNQNTRQAKAIFRLNSERRWCLTGTPVQNNLNDYGSLMQFLRVAPVDNKKMFSSLIAQPLRAGGPHNYAVGKLQTLVSATTLRRTKAKTLASVLPTRSDMVHKVDFNDKERGLYDLLCEHANLVINQTLKTAPTGGAAAKKNGDGKTKFNTATISQLVLRLRQVSNHGADLLPRSLADELNSFGNASTRDHILFKTSCENCGTEDDARLDAGVTIPDCQHVLCNGCTDSNEEDICPVCSAAIFLGVSDSSSATTPLPSQTGDYENDIVMHDDYEPEPSTKVRALLQNLRDCALEKSVVFSCWAKMLDLVEVALRREGNIRFERIDGTMSIRKRKEALETFRTDDQIQVLLATVGSSCVGIDITVASRVHLLEPQYNPMTEEQALARVHRIGQQRPVVTIRYIMSNSYEERIQELQQKKLKLARLCSGGLSTRQIIEYLQTLKEILR